MRTIQRDRRNRRSDNTTLALHYQLDASRRAARLEGMILSDADGFCLAAAGDPEACNEVAARLPFIGRRVSEFEGVLLGAESAWRIRMQRMRLEGPGADPGPELYLCAIGDGNPDRDRHLFQSRSAVRRILDAAIV